jgi:4-hydroxy-tetrahydrodipicolinate synthase
LALNDEEKREIVRFTAGKKMNVPVMVGLSGYQLEETLDFVRFCETQSIDAYLMPVPLYAKPGLEGQTHWFKTLLDAVTRPAMLYNVPSRAGVKMNPEVLARLNGTKNAWAVKEASGSVPEFCALKKAGPDFAFYSGDDALTPDFSKHGAVGLVSVASNVWPVETNRFVRLAIAGKHEGLLPLWENASDTLFTASNPVPVKALMHAKKKIGTALVRAPLSTKDLPNIQPLLEADHAITKWHTNA